MALEKVKKDSDYFRFSDLTQPLGDISVCNFSGWSGLELFKFNLPMGKSISNLHISEFRPDVDDKEKIFFTTEGNIKFVYENLNLELKKFDAVDLSDGKNYSFEALEETFLFMVTSKNSQKINEKIKIFNFKKDLEKRDLWGGQIISRPYEGKELTLVLFELKSGFKFDDKGHPNHQITWLTSGEMDFYSNGKKDLLNSDKGISIGPNHLHGGISKGAVGFDAFYPKRIEEKYKAK